jgi:hypothetical protein
MPDTTDGKTRGQPPAQPANGAAGEPSNQTAGETVTGTADKMSRRMMLGGVGAGVLVAPLTEHRVSPAGPAQVSARPLSVRWSAGVVDDGVTDHTDAINKLYERAARDGATVEWETTLGKGFVISGSGVVVLQGARTAAAGCDLNRASGALQGAFLHLPDRLSEPLFSGQSPGLQMPGIQLPRPSIRWPGESSQ